MDSFFVKETNIYFHTQRVCSENFENKNFLKFSVSCVGVVILCSCCVFSFKVWEGGFPFLRLDKVPKPTLTLSHPWTLSSIIF